MFLIRDIYRQEIITSSASHYQLHGTKAPQILSFKAHENSVFSRYLKKFGFQRKLKQSLGLFILVQRRNYVKAKYYLINKQVFFYETCDAD
jgi:hypothetical protein